MNNIKIKKLVHEINEKRIIDNDKIKNCLKTSQIIETKSNMIIFLQEYAKINPYPGSYVRQEFLKCAALTKKYVNFIIAIVKIDNDILDRDILVGVYEKNPELVDYLYKELSKNTKDSIAYILGILLGGMGIKKPEKLFNLLSKSDKLVKPEPVIIAAIYETSFHHKIPQKFINLLIKYSNSKDTGIKFNAILVLARQFIKNKKVNKKLIDLAKTDDDTKNVICQASYMIRKMDKLFYLKLMQECAKTDDNSLILNVVSMHVGFISKDYPLECLAILKKWIKVMGSMVMPGLHMIWSAERIGETKCFKKIEVFLLEWINMESKRHTKDTDRILEFSLPYITYKIYKNNELHLLLLLGNIDYKQKRKSKFIVRTIETIFSEQYNQKTVSFTDSCRKLLEKIAIHQNIDRTVDQNIKNPMMQTLALVQNIRLYKKQIDQLQTKQNLKQFPNIISFFTRKKLYRLIDTKKDHPLVLYLSRSKITQQDIKRITKKIDKTDDEFYKKRLTQILLEKFHPYIILKDLDKSLENLKPAGTREIKGQILNESFYPGLMQLNVYTRFKKKYHAELEPKVTPKTLDVKLVINDKNYFFEIYTPERSKRLDYVRTAHRIDQNEIQNKIIKKFLTQLKACENLNSPVILILDNQNMCIGEYDIRNFLEGSLQFRIPFEGSNKKLKPHAIRIKDSFDKKFKEGNLLSVIILLQRKIDDVDLKIKLNVQTYKNPNAKFPIDEKNFKKIEDSLCNTVI